jgi:hypothetical protein
MIQNVARGSDHELGIGDSTGRRSLLRGMLLIEAQRRG